MKINRCSCTRSSNNYRFTLVTQDKQLGSGTVQNMSDDGIFVSMETTDFLSEGMLVDVKIIGREWDPCMPDLVMEIVVIEGICAELRFIDPLRNRYILFGALHQLKVKEFTKSNVRRL